MIPVYEPYLPKESLRYAHDALDSTWISSRGPYLEKVKEYLMEYWNTPYVILTNNGTAANILMARVLDKRNIVCPNNVYVAAWNAFYDAEKFLEPIDADIETWNFDFKKLPPNHWSLSILVVHNLGNIVDVTKLRKMYPDSVIMEDACEAFGGTYHENHAGTLSDMFSVSFFGNKNITSGEGGAFITYDEDTYLRAYQFWGQGVPLNSHRKFIHNGLGYNFRMTNVEAAILYGQLEYLDEILERKQAVFEEYKKLLKDVERVEFQKIDEHTKHSNWMFGIRIKGANYESMKTFFSDVGIETRPMFYPITEHKQFTHIRGKTDIARILSKECVILPSYPTLEHSQIAFISEKVKEYVR